jgi:hypothetical protein
VLRETTLIETKQGGLVALQDLPFVGMVSISTYPEQVTMLGDNGMVTLAAWMEHVLLESHTQRCVNKSSVRYISGMALHVPKSDGGGKSLLKALQIVEECLED